MITLQERVHGVKPPQDWQLNKLHHVFTVRKNNKNIGMLNDNLLSLSYGRIINKDIDTTEGLLPESFETYQIVYPGDIVLRLTDLQNDKRSIRQGLVKEKGIITSAYDAVYPASGHDSRYWAYALLAMDLAKYYYSMGGGVRQSIKFKDFPNDWLHTPSHDKQKEIADFLDHETARIDQLIEKKNSFLGLLEKKRESIIHDLSSAGLDPSAPKINCSLNWLETIPKHWIVEKLSWYFYAEKGKEAAKYTKEYCAANPGQHPVYSGQTTNNGIMGEINSYDYDVGENGVLFSTTVGAKAMHLRLIKGKFSLSQNCMIIKPYKKLDLRYFLYHMTSLFKYERGLIPEHMQASFRVEDLNRFRIAIPPENERNSIANEIEKKIKSIDPLIDKTLQAIEILKDLRKSIVTDTVTGQLDIHAWQKRGTSTRSLEKIEQDMNEGARAAC